MSWEFISWKGHTSSESFTAHKMSDSGTPGKYRRVIGVCRIVVIVLSVAVIALIVAFALVVSQMQNKLDSKTESCPASSSRINLDPPDVLPPFHDLTREEILSIKEYLYGQSDLNLVKPSEIACNVSYIYTMELHIPNKEQTLNFLDKGRSPPEREASVVIFRGDRPEPYVQEYIVSPLPNPIRKKAQTPRPFRYRPLTAPEIVGAVTKLHVEIKSKVGKILEESYGGTLGDCAENCLEFQMITPMSPASSGETMARKMWFWLTPVVEFWSLHPLDFLVLMDLTSNEVEKYTIDKIYYGNQMFKSLENLLRSYETGSVTKTKIAFPTKDKKLYSSMNRRGTLFPEEPLLQPTAFEPSGKRYSIEGRHIKYMGWDFDIRMSTISGPQMFDIRYNNERIVYELSLQDIAVFYSADSPAQRFADYVDSVALIGSRVRSLVSGTDCPSHSTYLSADHVIESLEQPFHVDRAFCVFEHNTGLPLRRHLSSSGTMFYEGMMDIVLTVRTIATVVNYDYIFDFIFHQNGAVEVKVVSTGYILTSFRFQPEDNYGFRLRDHVTGNIHHHMFHFKTDMDIHGTKNRFEYIEIKPIKIDNTQWSIEDRARYTQTRMVRNQVKSEKEAAVKYSFDKPKYLTFYNNNVLSPYGVPRAYRLFTRGISKQMVEEGTGQEPSVSWSRYQVAVTKYKEEERRSSSMYAIWDAKDPVVNFQSFIDDNEIINDEDQVTWVTMGIHHIPHMEDIPVTPTVGLDLGFFLLPYNYFDEDPAMGSGDALRIEPSSQRTLNHGLNIYNYGKSGHKQCLPEQSTFMNDIKERPNSIFDKPTGDVTI
ncbi:putative amine oxidase [copper-containing] [Mercenaria mercenaria]|uniref:putative amine oxidase [copper-containing] n=1 Tax=Mercenaria mercenaria TaxID=6596 RepID=UPI00234F5FC7|nr:putative amine oxidase [copper-containing] [Mercenaria mercenaria]